MENFNMNKKMFSGFFRLKKAFDIVAHDRILDELELMGVRGIALLFKRQETVYKNRQYWQCREVYVDSTATGIRANTVCIIYKRFAGCL